MFPTQQTLQIYDSCVRLYKPVMVFGQREHGANRKYTGGSRGEKSSIPHPQLWKCVWSKRWRLQLLEEAALSLIENETEIMFHVSCQVMVLKP